jgi:hypothetical protein
MCTLIIKKKHICVFIYVQPNIENGLTKTIDLGYIIFNKAN